MSDKIKYIKLKRSENYGFGFSILGGAGSELPPLIYDVIEGSPASKSNQLNPGDVILEINGEDVLSYTTKEVLNCLRLSTREVILKLKSDNELKEKVNHLRQAPNNSDILRTAITQDDLQGVKQILAKKSEIHTETTLNKFEKFSPHAKAEALKDGNKSFNASDEEIIQSSLDRNNYVDQQQNHNKKKSDESSSASANKSSSQRAPCATSPPLSEDESDIESLHSFHYSPKAVDIPSAVRLAKRLFALDGFKKSDVSRHLSKNNEFSRAVAEEYLRYFNFSRDTLDIALRKFLDKFSLSGETQERERVLVHFSRRYLDCNPGTFNSQDAVHTLTCALMLLNTDLHSQNIGRKMTNSEFIDNLAELNDGENFNSNILKSLYDAILAEPLKWATDEEEEEAKGVKVLLEEGHRMVGSNPFLSTPSGSGVVYKKGYIMRKCCVEPNGKKTAFGKRSWKMWFCVIQDLVLYLHKDEQGARRGPPPQMGQNAVRLHHALAQKAHDYSKKEHVFRLQTADQAEYLLQTSDSKELQAWIDAINFVASSLSAPPMAGAVGSQRKFQRPLLPCSITKMNVVEQLDDHTSRVNQIEAELNYMKTHPLDKNAKSATISNYREKDVYLTAELKRYQTYVYLLRSRLDSAEGISNIGAAVCVVGANQQLSVFDGVEVKEVGPEEVGGDSVGIVPPPIPERPRHSDSEAENEPEGDENKEDKGIQTVDKKKGDKVKRSAKEDEFKKELEKMIKEKEKRDKKREKLEKKEREETLKRNKRKQPESNGKKGSTNGDEASSDAVVKETTTHVTVNPKETNAEKSDGVKPEEELEPPEDPRVGTFERISALFKFSKLNRGALARNRRESSSFDDERIELLKTDQTFKEKVVPQVYNDIVSFPVEVQTNEKGPQQNIDSPPPLPPKPGPNSPIMKNLGTRVINA